MNDSKLLLLLDKLKEEVDKTDNCIKKATLLEVLNFIYDIDKQYS